MSYRQGNVRAPGPQVRGSRWNLRPAHPDPDHRPAADRGLGNDWCEWAGLWTRVSGVAEPVGRRCRLGRPGSSGRALGRGWDHGRWRRSDGHRPTGAASRLGTRSGSARGVRTAGSALRGWGVEQRKDPAVDRHPFHLDESRCQPVEASLEVLEPTGDGAVPIGCHDVAGPSHLETLREPVVVAAQEVDRLTNRRLGLDTRARINAY